ncbi:MAG: hypothetical protein ACI8P9_004968, partial [Parasphingorhabdus sp.]
NNLPATNWSPNKIDITNLKLVDINLIAISNTRLRLAKAIIQNQ